MLTLTLTQTDFQDIYITEKRIIDNTGNIISDKVKKLAEKNVDFRNYNKLCLFTHYSTFTIRPYNQ